MTEEGWYLDPYGAHQHRWVSAGRPTKLVRDDGVEGYDPAPPTRAQRPFVPAPPPRGLSPDTPVPDDVEWVEAVRAVPPPIV